MPRTKKKTAKKVKVKLGVIQLAVIGRNITDVPVETDDTTLQDILDQQEISNFRKVKVAKGNNDFLEIELDKLSETKANGYKRMIVTPGVDGGY